MCAKKSQLNIDKDAIRISKMFKKTFVLNVLNKMEEDKITKTFLSEKLDTSRAQINRILDPNYTGVSLDSLIKTACAVNLPILLDFSKR